MLHKRRFVFLMLVCLGVTIHAREKTVTLQNGPGYQGCLDTYIAHQLFDFLDTLDEALNHYGRKEIYVQNCFT